MKKPLKIGLFSLGAIVLLLAVLTAVLPYLLKLDAIKTMAEEKATAALGRQVSIGNTGLSLWTGPKVRLENLSIAEAEGFGDGPFAHLKSFDLAVRFLPILGGRVEVEHIILENPEVRVVRNAEGKWNYDDILAKFGEKGEEAKEGTPSPSGKETSGVPISFLARDIRVEGAKIIFSDETSQLMKKGISVEGINLSLMDVSLDRPMGINLSAGLGSEKADMTFAGKVGPVGDNPGKVPMDLQLTIPPFDLGRVAGLLGSVPWSLSGDISLKGSLKGILGEGLASRVDIASSDLEFDRGAAAAEKAPVSGSGERLEPIKPPLITVSGGVKVTRGRFEKIAFTDMTAELSQKGTRFKLDHMGLSAFSGRLEGSAWADLGMAPIEYGSKMKMDKVQINEVVSAFSSLGGLLFGEATSNLSLSGEGTDLAAIRTSLTGDGSFSLGTGRLTSANLLSGAAGAASLLGMGSDGKETEFDGMDASFSVNDGKFNFSKLGISTKGWSMKGSGAVGIDQSLSLSAGITLSPSTSSKIPENRLQLFPKDSKGRTMIPLKISGSVTSPRFALDTGAMQKAAGDQAKKKVRKKVEGRKEELKKKIQEDLGDKLKGLF